MPIYNTTPPSAIARWEQAQLLNEAGVSIALPYKSQQAALVPNAGKLGRHADVAVQFGGAPGAFSFVVEGAITAADSNNLVSQKLDTSEQIAFIRVMFTALANNVSVAATLTPD